MRYQGCNYEILKRSRKKYSKEKLVGRNITKIKDKKNAGITRSNV